MKLTTKGHYSVKALLDISLQPNYGPTSIKAIAQRQGLPAPYLEKLMIEMRKAGLVKSVRGLQGGYQLALRPEKISLGQILTAVGEGSFSLPHLQLESEQIEDWVTLTLWRHLHEKIIQALDSLTLADLYYDARSAQASQGEQVNFIV
jgi:Rrf2 family protein